MLACGPALGKERQEDWDSESTSPEWMSSMGHPLMLLQDTHEEQELQA